MVPKDLQEKGHGTMIAHRRIRKVARWSSVAKQGEAARCSGWRPARKGEA
jgi:hypothetical protein